MGRSIKVKILPDGSVEADFSGFAGSDCLDEAERLADILARFGLKVDPTAVRRKAPDETGVPTGEPGERRDRIPASRG